MKYITECLNSKFTNLRSKFLRYSQDHMFKANHEQFEVNNMSLTFVQPPAQNSNIICQSILIEQSV